MWRENGRLEVEHWSRGLILHGSTRLASDTSPTFASILVGSRTMPGLCLQLMIACFRSTLWITELPLVGSIPAVAYPLQRHVTPPQTGIYKPRPQNYNSLDSHNVLVNVTLYHNRTEDDASHELSDDEVTKDEVKAAHTEEDLHKALEEEAANGTYLEDDLSPSFTD